MAERHSFASAASPDFASSIPKSVFRTARPTRDQCCSCSSPRIRELLNRHRIHGSIHPLIVPLPVRRVFADHGYKVLVIADFAEQIFEHRAALSGSGFVALLKLGLQFRKFRDILRQLRAQMPRIRPVGFVPKTFSMNKSTYRSTAEAVLRRRISFIHSNSVAMSLCSRASLASSVLPSGPGMIQRRSKSVPSASPNRAVKCFDLCQPLDHGIGLSV